MDIVGKLKKIALLIIYAAGIVLLSACSAADKQSGSGSDDDTPGMQVSEEELTDERQEDVTEKDIEMKMNVQIGTENFTATLEDNEAAAAFTEMMKEEPVVIQMSDYSGFEKVGSLGTSLPASNSQITTQAGDIVLYNNSQIVIFYGSNSWSYTRLGRIDDLTGWGEALGSGDVTVTFSIPYGGVKEQGPGVYANELAQRGFAVLAFDPCHMGESGGESRHIDLYDDTEKIPFDKLEGFLKQV